MAQISTRVQIRLMNMRQKHKFYGIWLWRVNFIVLPMTWFAYSLVFYLGELVFLFLTAPLDVNLVVWSTTADRGWDSCVRFGSIPRASNKCCLLAVSISFSVLSSPEFGSWWCKIPVSRKVHRPLSALRSCRILVPLNYESKRTVLCLHTDLCTILSAPKLFISRIVWSGCLPKQINTYTSDSIV